MVFQPANQDRMNRIEGAFLEDPVSNQDAPCFDYIIAFPLKAEDLPLLIRSGLLVIRSSA